MDQRTYFNFDLIVERVGENYRARVLDSPAGQAFTGFEIPFSELELENFVLRMGRPRANVRRVDSSEMEAVKGCGERLFRAVFKDDVYAAFLRSRDCALEENRGLRVRLRIDVPEFHDYPWEYLYNAHLNQFLALSRETPVVRYLELPYPVQPLTVEPPLKILVMISSPEGYPQLQVEEEWKRLSSALAPLARRGLVTLDRLKKPTLSALQQHLRRGEYHIFHFIGHGKYSEHKQDGMLLLEEEGGQGRPVSGQYLGTVLHDHRSLRLVVLNACEGARTSQEDPYAGVAQTLVLQGIPAVIAMQFEILETAAITFAQEFYGAVADGFPVDAAVSEARKAIFAAGNDVEWGTPVLYMRTPQGVIFEIPEAQRVRHPLSDEPVSYVDKELEQKLEGLYTEGLAAFWVEDWDKACDRFQRILADRPDHAAAAAKLAEAKRQRQLSILYARAMDAQRAGDWALALQSLEELQKDSPDYKDAGTTLKTVKKQKQLADLYTEAKKLHAAQKWQAVAKVFDKIHLIDSEYPDPENLLLTAEKELAELKRLAELEELYSRAVRAMDAGRWEEAQKLLRQVQEKETDFLETERLLSKAEAKVRQSEAEKKRQDEINTLYEQAHGLLRSKKWRKALDKIEEIRKLDEQFDDPEKIAEQAQKELAREEQEAERQNELAAKYAEAVRLVREEKYQEALEKWQQIKDIDSKYPDRQRVQRTARKSGAFAKPLKAKRWISGPRLLWIGLGAIVTIGIFILGLVLPGNNNERPASPVISSPIFVSGGKTVVSTVTKMPTQAGTTNLSTATQATDSYADSTMYDDFNDPSDGGYNRTLWSPMWSGNCATVTNKSGKLSFTVVNTRQCRLIANLQKDIVFTKPFFMEAQLFLDPATTSEFTHLLLSIDATNKNTGITFGSICGIFGSSSSKQDIECWSGFSGERVDPIHNLRKITPKLYTIRIEVYPSTKVKYIVDGMLMDEYIISQPNQFKNLLFSFDIGMNMQGTSATGYFDKVRIGTIEDDLTIYDNFNDSSYDGKFNSAKWAYEQQDTDGSTVQQDGVLFFSQSGIDKGQTLRAVQYWPLKLDDSVVFEADLKAEMTSDGIVGFELNGDGIHAACGLHSMSDVVMAHCWDRTPDIFAIPVAHGTWHTVRMEVNLETNTITFFMDGNQLTEDHYDQSLRGNSVYLNINNWAAMNREDNTRPMIGYVDNVRIMPLDYVNP